MRISMSLMTGDGAASISCNGESLKTGLPNWNSLMFRVDGHRLKTTSRHLSGGVTPNSRPYVVQCYIYLKARAGRIYSMVRTLRGVTPNKGPGGHSATVDQTSCLVVHSLTFSRFMLNSFRPTSYDDAESASLSLGYRLFRQHIATTLVQVREAHYCPYGIRRDA